MAKGPAVVIVARHGARLDAADKSWHLTSPTPYDPPLTYGGWAQGRALGLRIAALLHQRDNEQAVTAKNGLNDDLAHLEFSKLDAVRRGRASVDGQERPKKKRKIIIHTSPYLRCVQTSTAVAAGLSQYQPPGTLASKASPLPTKDQNDLLATPPHAKPQRSKSPLSVPIPLQPLADPNLQVFPKHRKGPDKILLRIDAFLGEWLSPDYFEDITPPPNSTMMVAGAKADLLRRGDYIQELPNTSTSKGHFPGGWMKTEALDGNRPSSQDGRGSLAQMSPFKERSSSHGSSSSLQRIRSREAIVLLSPPINDAPHSLYEPPVPSYSVSPAGPIPRGYFAHAKEACIEVDFQWDSMRDPQNWGDGGEYGDEWSTMHKRFRKGLTGMMQWYREHGSMPPKHEMSGFMVKVLSNRPPPPIIQNTSEPFPATFEEDNEAEDDEELVLVLITHGAGCNALLGAISNQPVLIDVGLASLSMAVLRAEPRKPSVPTIYDRRLSVADPGMANTYEMKLLASTDHLRPGVDPSKLQQQQSQRNSPAMSPSPSLDYRRRFNGSPATNSPIDSPFTIGEPYRNWNSSIGSTRRTMSSGSNSRYMQNALSNSGTASPSMGLWSGARTPVGDASSDGRSSPGADMVLNFAVQHPKLKSKLPNTSNPSTASDVASDIMSRLELKDESESTDKATPLSKAQVRTGNSASPGLWGAKSHTKNSNGLWGPPKLDDVYEHGRGPKRRWTVTEREDSL